SPCKQFEVISRVARLIRPARLRMALLKILVRRRKEFFQCDKVWLGPEWTFCVAKNLCRTQPTLLAPQNFLARSGELFLRCKNRWLDPADFISVAKPLRRISKTFLASQK